MDPGPEFASAEAGPAGVAGAVARAQPPRRWAATRRAALMAAGCALAVGGWQFAGTDRSPAEVVPINADARPSSRPAPGAGPAAERSSPPGNGEPAGKGEAGGGAGEGTPASGAGTVVVHVAGAVQAPGVVEAAAGSRVFEVLERAGGALPEADLSAVNLAAAVLDGQQILVPRIGEPLPPPDAGAAAAAGQTAAPVNINTAGAADLEVLPRVGPVLAERIVQWRTEHGSFTRPEDLDAVPGIGPAMLEALLPLVTV
ncbi:competence protein ComEA [Arthrobacter subterraneus]|uniref:Competence protein ComEA n=2 Tax=Arthrobacter subterraneus TaxID=335973 RepID=A0A1G8EUC6_9MICC|nr:competence protein ComEA [Arthrobacter subterraneus]